MGFGHLKKETKKGLHRELEYIVKCEPLRINKSIEHRPTELYVSMDYGKKHYRIYFEQEPELKITAVYKHNKVLGKYRRFASETRHGLSNAWANAKNPLYWMNILRPKNAIPLTSMAFLLFMTVAPSNALKTGIQQTFYTMLARGNGYIGDVEILKDGRIELNGTRKVVDGTQERVNVKIDPVDWLLYGSSGDVERRTQDGQRINEKVNMKGDQVYYRKNGQNKGEKTWISGKASGNEVIWDEAQGSGKRKNRIAGHKIEVKKSKVKITDIKKK